MISHKYKMIFVHISKTGGSSIEAALDPSVPLAGGLGRSLRNTKFPEKHKSAENHLKDTPELFHSYYSFSFVRNPWDRFVSLWTWMRHMGKLPNEFTDNFDQWVSRAASKPKHTYRKMLALDGKVIVDFVGKFESLETDFAQACAQVGAPDLRLPHTNNLSKRPHYSTYYTARTRRLVAKHFEWEIDSFEYSFESV